MFTTPSQSKRATGPKTAIRILASLRTWLGACRERARQRRSLARLPEDLLQDIGLTRADVENEVEKPFWRV